MNLTGDILRLILCILRILWILWILRLMGKPEYGIEKLPRWMERCILLFLRMNTDKGNIDWSLEDLYERGGEKKVINAFSEGRNVFLWLSICILQERQYRPGIDRWCNEGGLSCKVGHPVIKLNEPPRKKKKDASALLRSLRTTTNGPRNKDIRREEIGYAFVVGQKNVLPSQKPRFGIIDAVLWYLEGW